MIKNILFLLCWPLVAFSQKPQSAQRSAIHAFSLKPANFSNINLAKSDNDGFVGYSFGIAYEQLFCQNSHWSWVIPVTYVMDRTFLVTDYRKQGYQLYFTPGLKYYLKEGYHRSGWNAGINALAGFGRYNYSGRQENGSAKYHYYGILGSWMYNLAVGKSFGFTFEFGLGCRYNVNEKTHDRIRVFPLPPDLGTEVQRGVSGIMNISVGLSKWF